MPEKKYLNYEGQEFSEIEKGIMHESENALVFVSEISTARVEE